MVYESIFLSANVSHKLGEKIGNAYTDKGLISRI